MGALAATADQSARVERLLRALRAVAEPTRLRILWLCGQAELTVSELGQILGQSQPRVSRHLKLLVDARVLERNREGIWAYYRAAALGTGADLARVLLELIPSDDAAIALDLERLEDIKAERARRAEEYFRRNSELWGEIRSLHVDEGKVESALAELLPRGSYRALLDIGTGTGRMLELLAPPAGRAVGIDRSPEMLTVARANIDRAGLAHCQVRKADMYHLPVASESFDALTLHMVLHYAEDPARVIAEAARVTEPGGRLVIVDFAPHGEESLCREHAHRWMGFSDDAVAGWLEAAGLEPQRRVRLGGEPLTVCLWPARRLPAATPLPRTEPTERATAPR